MEEAKKSIWRILVLILLVLFAFTVFSVKLISMQLIHGDSYLQQVNRTSNRTQVVEAARGEITDRYGRPFAVNRMTYSIVFDRTFMKEEAQNNIILMLFPILEKAGEEWVDTLPIQGADGAYTFEANREKDVTKLIETLRLNDYATAQNCMDALIVLYKLEEIPTEYQRKMAGVRYQMELDYFTISTPYTFAKDVSMNTVSQIKERSMDFPGVDASTIPIREYVSGSTAPHLMGSVGPIYAEKYEALKEKGYRMNELTGNGGIEEAMEDYLRGKSGQRTIEQDNFGAVINAVETKAPVPGNTVVLTIDKRLQDIAQQSLANSIRQIASTSAVKKGADANAGAAAVIDVTNGEVLALATYPSYDLATYKQTIDAMLKDDNRPLFNRAIMGTYEPGSVMKPAMSVAGLEEKVITANSTYNCTLNYTYFSDRGDHTYTPQCLSRHGALSVINALAVSCNIFFYETGRNLGIERMNQYCTKLGLGQKVGLEIPEYSGILAGPGRGTHVDSWLPGDTVQAAIGQSDNTFTPLQMAVYCATVANGGTRYKAHLVKEIKSYDLASTIQDSTPVVADTVSISDATYKTVTDGMRAVCTTGTARATFANYKMKVAGKTGTAQVPSGSDNATFICYAPYDDPKIAIAVVVEHGYHGSSVTNVARDIIEAYFYYTPEQKAPVGENQILG